MSDHHLLPVAGFVRKDVMVVSVDEEIQSASLVWVQLLIAVHSSSPR
jgi:hypothetical protein